jgi:glutamyl-tRNA synthetase
MNISHIIRGEDHIGNTPKQILLYQALGAKTPEFGHTPLILNEKGAKLSKRDGVTSISEFQQMGYTAEAIANYMTLLGWSPPEGMNEIFNLEDAAKVFGFERVDKAGAKFDWDKLNWINSQYLHAMPADHLIDLLIPYWQSAGYEFDWTENRPWLEQVTALVGPSLARLDEAVAMTRYLFIETVGFTEEATKKLRQDGSAAIVQGVADALVTAEPLSETSAPALVKQVATQLGRKEGQLKPILRVALTGDTRGPDLIQSWLLLHQRGWDKIRLQTALEVAQA